MPDAQDAKADARDGRLSGPMRMWKREEEFVRKQMTTDALNNCHETRDAYIACAKGRSITSPFFCKGLFREFNECLKQYTTDAEFDRRKAEFERQKQAALQSEAPR